MPAPSKETLDAAFGHGVLRLVSAPNTPLREGQRVWFVVQPDDSPDAILALAADVYAEPSPQEIAAVERFAFERRDFFDNQA